MHSFPLRVMKHFILTVVNPGSRRSAAATGGQGWWKFHLKNDSESIQTLHDSLIFHDVYTCSGVIEMFPDWKQ